MAVTSLDKAKVSIVTQHPFFASILMKRQLIEDETIPTAAVDQRGQIYINPVWFDTLSVDEIVFVLAHEIGHVIGQHATRRGARQPKKWNIAGDAWINDMLKASNIGQPIKGCVDMPGSKRLSKIEVKLIDNAGNFSKATIEFDDKVIYEFEGNGQSKHLPKGAIFKISGEMLKQFLKRGFGKLKK